MKNIIIEIIREPCFNFTRENFKSGSKFYVTNSDTFTSDNFFYYLFTKIKGVDNFVVFKKDEINISNIIEERKKKLNKIYNLR